MLPGLRDGSEVSISGGAKCCFCPPCMHVKIKDDHESLSSMHLSIAYCQDDHRELHLTCAYLEPDVLLPGLMCSVQ